MNERSNEGKRMGFAPIQIIIVLAIILLVFGARRLPEIGRGLGGGMRAFTGSLTGREQAAGAAAREVRPVERDDLPGTSERAADTADAGG